MSVSDSPVALVRIYFATTLCLSSVSSLNTILSPNVPQQPGMCATGRSQKHQPLSYVRLSASFKITLEQLYGVSLASREMHKTHSMFSQLLHQRPYGLPVTKSLHHSNMSAAAGSSKSRIASAHAVSRHFGKIDNATPCFRDHYNQQYLQLALSGNTYTKAQCSALSLPLPPTHYLLKINKVAEETVMCALAFSKNEILKANVPLCPPLPKAIWHKLHGRSLLLPLFQRKLPPKFFPTAPMFARSGKHVTDIRWLALSGLFRNLYSMGRMVCLLALPKPNKMQSMSLQM
jgi:hypothetical protein